MQPLLYSSQVAGSRASNLGGARAPSRGGDSWADSHHMNHHGGGGPGLRVSQQVCVFLCSGCGCGCGCACAVVVCGWMGGWGVFESVFVCLWVRGWVGG